MFEQLIEKHRLVGFIGAKIVDDTKEFTVSVSLPPPEGKATITEFDAPSEFKPGVSFTVTVRIRNDGGDDTLYIRLKNKDTGAILKDVSHAIPSGDQWRYAMILNITQTTDFHGRIEVGHEG